MKDINTILMAGFASVAIGLVGKIVWDWLSNRSGNNELKAQVKADMGTMKAEFEKLEIKLESLVDSIGKLTITLSENYAKQSAIERLWNKIEELQTEIVDVGKAQNCRAHTEAMSNLKEDVRAMRSKV